MQEEAKLKLKLESLTIKDHAFDLKIEAFNISATVNIKDYLEIAGTIKNNNDLQRKRVANPSTVYSLLKDDMKNGCLIPSIVLALDDSIQIDINKDKIDYESIANGIRKLATNLKILDGLQRTNILIDLKSDLEKKESKSAEQIEADAQTLKDLYDRKIRIEIYINVSRFGILYRMLTLNTGQTPMSLRHQIEILYSDYYIQEKDGIRLIRDAFDGKDQIKVGQYKFSDIVEGVTSFIDGSEFTLDRFDLLTYIKSLKSLSAERSKADIFSSYVELYDTLLRHLVDLAIEWKFDYKQLSEENLSFFPVQRTDDKGKELRLAPFGQTAEDIFIKSQIFTGLGCALNQLKSKGVINTISDLKEIIPNIKFETTPKDSMDVLTVRLEQIRKDSKKIGESQRTFFRFFFLSLFNKYDDDSYLIIEKAVESAYRKTT